MPAPNIMAATLVRRTSRMKIAIVGNGFPLRDHPLRAAEEVAMLDVIIGGRIISGFVRGIGDEYYSMGMNPTFSQERFKEAGHFRGKPRRDQVSALHESGFRTGAKSRFGRAFSGNAGSDADLSPGFSPDYVESVSVRSQAPEKVISGQGSHTDCAG